ncbi:hypothetical protein D3C87_1530960 [compost metagenome]
MRRIRSAAQDHRIAGFQAQCAGVSRHIGTAFINHADDAERRADTLDIQSVRTIPGGNHLSDRILEFGDLAQRLRHSGNTLFRQCQAIDEGWQQALAFHLLQVFGICRKNPGHGRDDRIRHAMQRRVLRLR